MDSWHGVAQEAISEALSFKLDMIYKWNVWQSYSQQWKFVQGQAKHFKNNKCHQHKERLDNTDRYPSYWGKNNRPLVYIVKCKQDFTHI